MTSEAEASFHMARVKCNTCTQWFDIDPESKTGSCPCGATRVVIRDGKQIAVWTD